MATRCKHAPVCCLGPGCNSTSDPATSSDTLILTDMGNGTATYSAVISGRLLEGVLSLNSPAFLLYGKPCTFLQMANVRIKFQKSSSSQYNANNMATWIQKLGLDTVTSISGGLTVYVDHLPNPVPFPISPIFFTSLRMVAQLTIQECLDCSTGTGPAPAGSALQSLPGLSVLTKFWSFAARSSAVTSATIKNTAFLDFKQTLPGLVCSPGQLIIQGNSQLTSLAGLDKLVTTLRPGPKVDIQSNSQLVGPSSVAALSALAGCPSTPLSSSISIQAVSCFATVSGIHHHFNFKGHTDPEGPGQKHCRKSWCCQVAAGMHEVHQLKTRWSRLAWMLAVHADAMSHFPDVPCAVLANVLRLRDRRDVSSLPRPAASTSHTATTTSLLHPPAPIARDRCVRQ